jgi:hypothetical protein
MHRASAASRRRRMCAATALVAAMGAACAPPRFDGTVYRRGPLGFRLGEAPAGWRQVAVSHALVAFRDDAADATIAVNGRCGADGDDVPLASLTQHLFMGFTDRRVLEQKLLAMDGREALRTLLRAKLDGVDKAFAVVVLKKDGCVYDFLYMSRPESFERGAGAFDAFVGGFRTIRAGGEDG